MATVLGAYIESQIIRHSHDFDSVHLKRGFNECVICAHVFAHVLCLCMSVMYVCMYVISWELKLNPHCNRSLISSSKSVDSSNQIQPAAYSWDSVA